MMGIFDERAGIMATAIQAEVRGQMERKLNELHAELKEKFEHEFEKYRHRVLKNIEVTKHHDVLGDQTRLIFDIKIGSEEMQDRMG